MSEIPDFMKIGPSEEVSDDQACNDEFILKPRNPDVIMISDGISKPTSKAQTADSFKTTSENLETSQIGSTDSNTIHAHVQNQGGS